MHWLMRWTRSLLHGSSSSAYTVTNQPQPVRVDAMCRMQGMLGPSGSAWQMLCTQTRMWHGKAWPLARSAWPECAVHTQPCGYARAPCWHPSLNAWYGLCSCPGSQIKVGNDHRPHGLISVSMSKVAQGMQGREQGSDSGFDADWSEPRHVTCMLAGVHVW